MRPAASRFAAFRPAAVVASIYVASAVVMSPLLRAPLLFDDTKIVELDPFIASAMKGEAAPRASFFGGLLLQSRPVRLLTHRADALVAGPSLVWPHAANIALHFAAGLAFFALLGRLGVSRRIRCAALAVFLVHPVCMESVAILSHRKETLSALFLVGALLLSLSPSWRTRILAAPLLFLAIFSKETAAVFPALWLLAEAVAAGKCPARGPDAPPAAGCGSRDATTQFPAAPLWPEFAFWTLLALAFGALAFLQIRHGMEALNAAPELDPDRAGHFHGGAPWGLAISAAARAFPRYLKAFVIPWGHSLDPVFRLDVGLASRWTACALLAWLAYGAALLVLWRRKSRFFAPAAWIPLALSPYLFPPLLRSGGTSAFCDRYAYLAAMGFAWLVAEAIARPWRTSASAAALAAILMVEATATFAYACDCRDPVLFWERVCRLNPESYQSRSNLAVAFWREKRDPFSARAEFERMRSRNPGFPFGMASYANFLASRREFDAAIAVAQESLRHSPGNRRLLGGYALILLDAGRHAEALKAFHDAEAAGYVTPRFVFGHAEACRKNLLWDEAYGRYRRAADMDPKYRRAVEANRKLVADPPLPPGEDSIAVFGDSVPHGEHARGPDTYGPPLAERLAARLGNVPARDASVPGQTAQELAGGLSRALRGLPFHPRWCIIWTGHNDAFFGRQPTDILRDMSECILCARASGSFPLVIGPIPVADAADGKSRKRQDRALAALDFNLARFCAAANVTFVSARRTLAVAPAPAGGWLVAEDGNHLVDEGLERIADACTAAIRSKKEEPDTDGDGNQFCGTGAATPRRGLLRNLKEKQVK